LLNSISTFINTDEKYGTTIGQSGSKAREASSKGKRKETGLQVG
jgi:hypothetical protein